VSAGAELLEALATALGEPVRTARPVGGGSINDALRVELESGALAFVKSRPGASAADFEAEAAGLRWLDSAGAVALPEVLALGERPAWLALGWIEPGRLSPAAAEELGRSLAALHRSGASAHGELPPGHPDSRLRLGSVEVEIGPEPSWPRLYAERMLSPLNRRASDAGSISSADADAVGAVCERIEELAGPAEEPSRLHGDLWGGNVLAGADGRARLIDPAAYGGHREVDLAMLRLFGGPGERTFAAYDEAHPPADAHRERVGLWQLLPLLVHAVLFGGGYGAQAGAAARRYL
jgi:fructosamine-3-kinase